MSTLLTKDARGFVEGVVTYLRQDGRSQTMVPKIQELLGKVTDQAKKEKVAHLDTSVLLSGQEKTAIGKALAKIVGHEVGLECAVKPNLLGGLKIQIGDWVLDRTISSQLQQMASMLLQ